MKVTALALALSLAAPSARPERRANFEPFVLLVAGGAALGVGLWRLSVANQLGNQLDALPRMAASRAEAEATLRLANQLRVQGTAESNLVGLLVIFAGALFTGGVSWLVGQGLEVDVMPGPTRAPSSAALFRF